MDTTSDFVSWWLAEFRGTPPVGWRLREAFRRRWVRFHSLPGSKRYAQTPAEMVEIHRRHDAVAEALLGEDEPIVVVRAGFSQTDVPVPPLASDGAWPQEGFSYARGWLLEEADSESGYAHSWIAPATFVRGAFDHVWTLAANDVVEGVLLVNTERRCVFAPYDGGMDVIAADIFVCDSISRDFREWLAPEWSRL